MNWSLTPEDRGARLVRARQRRAQRLAAYGSTRVRWFPHDPFDPQLEPESTKERGSNRKLFGWQIEGIRGARQIYDQRQVREELRRLRVRPGRGFPGADRTGRVSTKNTRARSEKAEMVVRVLCLMLTLAQRQAGVGFKAREIGEYRNGRLWLLTLPAICALLAVGQAQPSVDQVGDALNCLAANGFSFRWQDKEQGPSHWKLTRKALDYLRVSKLFDQSAGMDPDFEYYMRQVLGKNPHLNETDAGRAEAKELARKLLWTSKPRPPPT